VENDKGAPTLARGRLESGGLADVRDILVTDAYPGTGGLSARIAFGRDGMLYMATGGNVGTVAQEPGSLRGKILRLRDDGSAPPDNPFANRTGYRPDIYTLGHRNSLGLMVHPETGALWNNENGPNGGDEINIILPGRNYGWPVVSFGRDYAGPRISEHPTREGMESPIVVWIPSIAVSGMIVYTGDRFPNWKGNVFVGSMRTGEIPGTGHLERIVFNERTEELRRESLLGELRQRIRDVRQGDLERRGRSHFPAVALPARFDLYQKTAVDSPVCAHRGCHLPASPGQSPTRGSERTAGSVKPNVAPSPGVALAHTHP
jgi:aldose sugar dehydrogenase